MKGSDLRNGQQHMGDLYLGQSEVSVLLKSRNTLAAIACEIPALVGRVQYKALE